jgi:hypothetical protein
MYIVFYFTKSEDKKQGVVVFISLKSFTECKIPIFIYFWFTFKKCYFWYVFHHFPIIPTIKLPNKYPNKNNIINPVGDVKNSIIN